MLPGRVDADPDAPSGRHADRRVAGGAALAGAALLGGASRTTLAAVLAFEAAALLHLVVAELLVEAHETAETPLLAAIFFVRFIGLYAVAA